MHSAPLVLVRSNTFVCTLDPKFGILINETPAAVALDQMGTMLSPCSPRMRALI